MCAGALITSLVFPSSAHASTHESNRDLASVAPLLSSEKIAPWLVQQFSMGGKQDVFVVMNAPSDLRAASAISSRADRGDYVYDALREQAEAQVPLVDWLRSKGHQVTRFWIVNAILVKQADAALIDALARRDDVGRLVGNPLVDGLARSTVTALEPTRPPGGGASSVTEPAAPGAMSAADVSESTGTTSIIPPSPLSPQAIECGVSAVHADGVWNQTGLRGDGIVVGTMDTGVEWTHSALKGHYRGWNGATADHSYSWHDAIAPSPAPLDDNHHGTHVTGTMIGDDPPDTIRSPLDA